MFMLVSFGVETFTFVKSESLRAFCIAGAEKNSADFEFPMVEEIDLMVSARTFPKLVLNSTSVPPSVRAVRLTLLEQLANPKRATKYISA